MKAAVLHRHGGAPTYQDHPDPVTSKGLSLVRVSAAPIVPLDLLCASGTSYFGPHLLTYFPVSECERGWLDAGAGGERVVLEL